MRYIICRLEDMSDRRKVYIRSYKVPCDVPVKPYLYNKYAHSLRGLLITKWKED